MKEKKGLPAWDAGIRPIPGRITREKAGKTPNLLL
jgi:hypothetical protein